MKEGTSTYCSTYLADKMDLLACTTFLLGPTINLTSLKEYNNKITAGQCDLVRRLTACVQTN